MFIFLLWLATTQALVLKSPSFDDISYFASDYLARRTEDFTPDFQATDNDLPYTFGDYGSALVANKAKLILAFNENGFSQNLQDVLLAMAFLETNTLESSARDASKDNMGDAANISLWNINIYLINMIGFSGDPWSLNDDLVAMSQLIVNGINKFGLARFLNAVRGGQTAMDDGVSYDVQDYRNTIATTYNVIQQNIPTILIDSRRVQIDLEHV